MLSITNLHVTVDNKEVVKGVTLAIRPGEIHVLMGPNGSGKSSLAMAVAGHPRYEVARNPQSAIRNPLSLDGIDIVNKTPDQRARMGLFLAMQYPVGVEGVTPEQLLRRAVQEKITNLQTYKNTKKPNIPNIPNVPNHPIDLLAFRKQVEKLAEKVGVTKELLHRSINVGSSGGEKKRLEILQMLVLQPKYAILDETDSGLDIDALRVIAKAVNRFVHQALGLRPELRSSTPRLRRSSRGLSPFDGEVFRTEQPEGLEEPRGTRHQAPAVLVITHYARLLKHLKPDVVHVMKEGKIIESGGKELAERIERNGYNG